MKHFVISLALLVMVAIASSARDRLYIENFSIKAGETLLVPVILLNDTAYSGLQTDLYLPEGLTLDMEDDEYIIDLTSRKDNSHTIESHLMENGAIRIYVSSVGAKEFSGNNGAIMTLRLTAESDFSKQAIIELKNTICAEAIGTRHKFNDEICNVNSGDGPSQSGDVNGDGVVNIGDINVLINLILAGKISQSGDVNNDGQVNIVDINVVIDIILKG